MSIPIFNVPNAPGVPPMVRSVLTGVSTAQGLIAGVRQTIQFFQGRPPLPSWGVYDSNFKSVVTADSFLSFHRKKTANIPTFPVQDGQLSSYDKVQLPGTDTIRIIKTGTLADRKLLVQQVDTLIASLNNFTLVTPEKSYPNVNCYDYDITKSDNKDAYTTIIDLIFQDIPTTSAVYTTTNVAATTNAVQPSAQPPVNQGVVQPTTPSVAAQAQAIATLGGTLP
jgi:hypothetical protein